MEVPLTELMDAGVVQGSTVNGADGRNRTGVHGDARVTYMARAPLNDKRTSQLQYISALRSRRHPALFKI